MQLGKKKKNVDNFVGQIEAEGGGKCVLCSRHVQRSLVRVVSAYWPCLSLTFNCDSHCHTEIFTLLLRRSLPNRNLLL